MARCRLLLALALHVVCGAGGGLLSEQSEKRSFVDLDLFDEQIRAYLDLQSEIASLRHVCDIDFLHINAQPIKQAISTWVAKWIYLFTQYLQVSQPARHNQSSSSPTTLPSCHVD